ncbi:hypothetical protein SAMN05216299_10110 [Nitrosospira sp. Nsp14]|uniref:hypothetical protein n=1 Tax=Nitrosospira sp. Nsp14 TaxID=1855333 RepID=UPI0008E5A98C|nr:hypothetical protein [Nitrosospira sp. Nsp14]SFH13074.1 hypothetical protein SAMN05216299_10110 [Nitrosospira sp. Nsp14]
METFDIDHPLVGTGRVFPSNIEQMDWTGDHETSSCYPARIESDGFLMEKPIPVDHPGRISSCLNGIRGAIDAIRLCDPVIYAVDLNGLERIEYQTVTSVNPDLKLMYSHYVRILLMRPKRFPAYSLPFRRHTDF